MDTEIYRLENSQVIKGTILNIFLIEGERYFLVDLKVYADGFLDCFGPVSVEELDRNFKSGRLSIEVPKDKVSFISFIGPVRISNFYIVDTKNREPIEEIKKVIINLNREDSESDR